MVDKTFGTGLEHKVEVINEKQSNEGHILSIEYQNKILIWISLKNVYVCYCPSPRDWKNMKKILFKPIPLNIINQFPKDSGLLQNIVNVKPSIHIIKSYYLLN